MKEPTRHLFANRAQWRAWLEEHHAQEKQAWLIHYKKGAGASSLAYEEAVEEALCFGWIDGLLRRLDADRYALRYSPRRRKSIWSESNKQRVEKLIRQGRMTQAGLDKIAEAQESGEWEAVTRRENVDVLPADLEQALQARKKALAAFRGLSPSRKKQLIWWITSAKRDATRQKRIQAAVKLLMEERPV